MATFCKLLEDMVVEILSRLPPKSLMRFKCVQKSWYNLINSPSFVAKHLSNSSTSSIIVKHTVLNNTNITDEREKDSILCDIYSNEKEIRFSLLNLCNETIDDEGDCVDEVVEQLHVPQFPMSKHPFNIEISGHFCDGIICLDNLLREDCIVLCNPAIKEIKHLPKSVLLLPEPDLDDDDGVDTVINVIGCGYDSKTKQYKVVRTVEFWPGCTRAEVYTLGANSWREIEYEIESQAYWSPSSHVSFKGICYWIGSDVQENDVLLSFDMGDEVFHNIPLPDIVHGRKHWYKSILVWNESIAFILYILEQESGVSMFDIWVMDDSGDKVKGSWIKRMTIESVPDIRTPLVFLKSDELLMSAADGRVVCYNLNTRKLRYLPIRGVEGPDHILASVYVNSIVSVKGDNKLEGIDI